MPLAVAQGARRLAAEIKGGQRLGQGMFLSLIHI